MPIRRKNAKSAFGVAFYLNVYTLYTLTCQLMSNSEMIWKMKLTAKRMREKNFKLSTDEQEQA